MKKRFLFTFMAALTLLGVGAKAQTLPDWQSGQLSKQG